jgi:DNA-binding transcriptional ArsR family regulator
MIGGMSVVLEQAHPPVSELRLSKILAALSDSARLATVRALARNEHSPCNQLHREAGLEISRSTFSHHQKVLREAGILLVQVRGAERICSLRRDDLNARFPGLLDLILNTQDEMI